MNGTYTVNPQPTEEEYPKIAKWRKDMVEYSPGENGAIVMKFSYKYNPGKEAEARAILEKVIKYNIMNAMCDNRILTNYRFTPTAGGYDAIEVFNSGEAACEYYKSFEECPFIAEVMTLAGMVT
jgi:hypothetical protein